MTQLTQEFDYSTVLASSIHDMKNSLSLLLGTLSQVTQQCQPGSCKSSSQFSQLQYEGKRVNDHLVQLLALYRIDNSQYFVNTTENDVSEFLDEITLEHQDMLAYRNINFDIDCEDGIYGFFDRDLISGVITNIINNLYVYSKDRMQIQVETQNKYLVIHIKDNGKGYPDNMLCSTEQEQKGISFSSGSTGLGLYFAAKAAEMHKNKNRNGYISISNHGIDGGGCFSIYLP
jgi:two-component system, OmpR family, sensor histidine kinase SenX3